LRNPPAGTRSWAATRAACSTAPLLPPSRSNCLDHLRDKQAQPPLGVRGLKFNIPLPGTACLSEEDLTNLDTYDLVAIALP
jgi:hypothetical protein